MNSAAPVRTFFIRTFGCQMNEHDSDRMAQLLEAEGLRQVSDPRRADLVIINSCSVRAKPEHKALSEAGRFRQARRDRGVRIVLAGCVAQQHAKALLARSDGLDAVIGPDAIVRLPRIVAELAAGRGPVLDVEEHDSATPGFVPLQPSRSERPAPISRPVTIMKGCDNFCAYCVVPLVRGREASRSLDAILREVEELGRRGTREVVLLGQNVNSYRDPAGARFPELLRRLDAQAAVQRIRFTTSHPKDLGDELMAAMAELPRVTEHLHLALQAGADRVLERMRRGYTRAAFLERIARLRAAVPGLALTTDLIVGFPGESQADFQETLEVVEQAAFDGAFSFKYSPRPGTLAAGYQDDVPAAEKQARLERLQVLLRRLEAASLERLLGRELEVLIEGTSLRDPDALTGRSRCNRVVNFTCPGPLAAGGLVGVRILEVRGHTLGGEAVRPASS
jgi:tRNA-2-methylthio-N6-dimethylallyladenosine synthase